VLQEEKRSVSSCLKKKKGGKSSIHIVTNTEGERGGIREQEGRRPGFSAKKKKSPPRPNGIREKEKQTEEEEK